MLDLSENVILVGMGSTKIPETVRAISHCLSLVKFYDTLLLTDIKLDSQLSDSIKIVNIENIPSYIDYQRFVVSTMPNILLDSISPSFRGHFLFINWDGFIVNSKSWSNQFLLYDYIGAPWPWFGNVVGNGGFCLKSRKFIETQRSICSNHIVSHNEDVELCIVLRKIFEEHGCKYADKHIGYMFSTEYGVYDIYNSFGFHDFKYHPKFKTIINI